MFLTGVLGLNGGPNFRIGLFNQDVAVVHGSLGKEKLMSVFQSGRQKTKAAQANGGA
jgi:hypothetical protein